jgi:hypothetical protein
VVVAPKARRQLGLLREAPFPVVAEQLMECLRRRANEAFALGGENDRRKGARDGDHEFLHEINLIQNV